MAKSTKRKSKDSVKSTSASTKYRKAHVYANVLVMMNLPYLENDLPSMAKMRIEVEHFDSIKVQKIHGVYFFDGTKTSSDY